MRVLNYDDYHTRLTRIPDISNLPNLEEFSIQICKQQFKFRRIR